MAPSHWPAFVEFSREHLASGDIDPVYPVLKHLVRDDGREAAHSRVFAYLAWYSLASSEAALAHGLRGWPWKDLPTAEPIWARYPTGTERRALRGGKNIMKHLEALTATVTTHGSWEDWLARGLTGSQLVSWERMRLVTSEPWGNGRWASYKTCEILWKVLGYPLEATDMGNEFSSGPREGLAIVLGSAPRGNSPDVIRELDRLAEDLRERLEDDLGHPLGIEELETLLCDWKSTVQGNYYVGRDTDEMLEGLEASFVPEEVRARVLEARAATLPHAYLGELNDWSGVDKDRKSVYREHGAVVVRA